MEANALYSSSNKIVGNVCSIKHLLMFTQKLGCREEAIESKLNFLLLEAIYETAFTCTHPQ